MSFQFDTSELDALASRMAGADRIVQQHLVRGVSDAGKIVEGHAKGIAPVKTGNYRRNITSQASAVAGGATAIVRAGAPYSIWVERGRGPVVARGRALRFEVGGRVVYTKRVGPAAGHYVFRRTLAATRARVRARLEQAGRDAVRDVFGGGA